MMAVCISRVLPYFGNIHGLHQIGESLPHFISALLGRFLLISIFVARNLLDSHPNTPNDRKDSISKDEKGTQLGTSEK